MGGGIAGGGTLPQTSSAIRLELDGHGGTGGKLDSSVVGEVPGMRRHSPGLLRLHALLSIPTRIWHCSILLLVKQVNQTASASTRRTKIELVLPGLYKTSKYMCTSNEKVFDKNRITRTATKTTETSP